MYVKLPSIPLLEIQVQQDEFERREQTQGAPNAFGENDGDQTPGKKTPRRSERLPPTCRNNSLHIDFAELKLSEMIGQGAFGSVHRATWRGTTVAVKILVCQQLTPDVVEEFETEVQIMSILRHPNICLLMGACLDPPTRCLVVEYLPKGSLWNVLRQDVVIDYPRQLRYRHSVSLLHAGHTRILIFLRRVCFCLALCETRLWV